MARDEKIPADTVTAVSAVHIIAPSVFFARCAALDEARKNDAERSTTWRPPMPAPRISPSPSWVRSTTAP